MGQPFDGIFSQLLYVPLSVFILLRLAGFDEKSVKCGGGVLRGEYGRLGRVASPAFGSDGGRAPAAGNRARTRKSNTATEIHRLAALQKRRLAQSPHPLVQRRRKFADKSPYSRFGAGDAAD